MTAEELKDKVRGSVSKESPDVTVLFEELFDDKNHLGVCVYGVEKENVATVTDLVLDLDWDLCAGTGFALTPLVRDVETTKTFYSHLVPKPHQSLVGNEYPLVCEMSASKGGAAWEIQEGSQFAANEELALAA